ncbi:MAG: hypothetical protein V7L31_32185 [Nostoc sp.]|uniref:hypothetical protein n=1 Tax=Nostoc sp. TaxID=1180 RepID=UPI002FEF9C90
MTSDQPSEQPVSESTVNEAFDLEQQEIADALFPIVGIAASAGGLEAFTEVLKPGFLTNSEKTGA